MGRKLNQLTRPLLRGSGLILPSPMVPMKVWIVKDRLWRESTRSQFRQRLLILFQKRKDDRNDLPSDPTNNFSSPNISTRSLIITALDRDQSLVNLGPFALFEANSLPDHQIHRLLHHPNASR